LCCVGAGRLRLFSASSRTSLPPIPFLSEDRFSVTTITWWVRAAERVQEGKGVRYTFHGSRYVDRNPEINRRQSTDRMDTAKDTDIEPQPQAKDSNVLRWNSVGTFLPFPSLPCLPTRSPIPSHPIASHTVQDLVPFPDYWFLSLSSSRRPFLTALQPKEERFRNKEFGSCTRGGMPDGLLLWRWGRDLATTISLPSTK
jgi:hypothetical protein